MPRMLTSDMWYICTYDDGTYGATLVNYDVTFDPMSPQHRFKTVEELAAFIAESAKKRAEGVKQA